MAQPDLVSPEDFLLKKVILSAERFGGQTIDLTNVTVEINIYENMFNAYLTGSIAILDDQNLYQIADFQGTERLTVQFSLPINGSDTVTKTFITTRMDRSIKTNDRTTVHVLSLMEEVAVYNDAQVFSKMYDGKGEQIVEKILNEKLNKNIYRGLNSVASSFQDEFRLLVPYVTPFEAINMCLRKITTSNGSPYFLYSTLASNDLVFTDLESILQTNPWNLNVPFVFSQSVNNNQDNSINVTSRSIYTINADNQEDTLFLAQKGAIGSVYNVTDINTGDNQSSLFDITNLYQKFTSEGILSSSQADPLFDDQFIPDPSGNNPGTINSYSSRVITQVSGETSPYSNINNYTAEKNIESYSLRLNSHALLETMQKNVFDLLVPGSLFLNNNVANSVGSQIQVEVFNNSIDDINNNLDPKKSGNFIIMSKRHIFNATDFKHTVSLSCTRISNREV